MAAYGALISLVNDLELIPNHPTHSFSFDSEQIASLSQTVNFLVDFLETYDSYDCTREAVEVLESRIAYAAHAAHDVIESHLVDQIHARSTLGGNARCDFSSDLQKAIDDIDFVKREAMKIFKTKIGLKMKQPTYAPPSSSEPLSSGRNRMVGFEAVSLRLMDMMVGGYGSQRLVIPIVGMGGMGKTTLAKNVYEHPLIVHHFDVHLWATISQEYSMESILAELVSRSSATDGNSYGLGEELHKKLWGRRYLIVLDDMWSLEAWDAIQMYFPDNGNGSRVVVTSRLSNLAAHLSSYSFEMNFLDEEKSWELFCEKAFGGEDCPVELKDIGKKIVKRCRGLPLSIVVIGGHLRRSSRSIEYWEKVAKFMNPISSSTDDEQCLNIISSSYHHLPAYLKPCFLYMGIFREDEQIYASELHKFWIAEGFLKQQESLSLEEVAEDYMQDLIDRNLILVRERRWNGKVEHCGVHDVVRELCLNIAEKEKFVSVLHTTQAISTEHRLVIKEGINTSDTVGALESAPLVRSLIRPRGQFYLGELSVELRLLRVSANVNNVSLKKDERRFPTANFQQVNLRYLAFSCHKRTTMSGSTGKIYLPSSISLFWNLQTLIIENYGVLIAAPYEIWGMLQLRHLEFVQLYLPDPLPCDKSTRQECIVLQNLHKLVGVENFRMTEEVCKRMPNIKELSLRYNNLPGDCEASSYYCLYNLGCFNKLKSLKCEFGDDSKWGHVALSFTFPSSLEELCLWNCHLDWSDLVMMIICLPYLGSLELGSVQGVMWDLVEEEFPCLKTLRISDCDDLIDWIANSSHFPVLETLSLSNTPKLREISPDIGEIPTLRRISLEGCGAYAAANAVRMVMEQEMSGNHDLQLHVYFQEYNREELKIFQNMRLTSDSLHLYYEGDKLCKVG